MYSASDSSLQQDLLSDGQIFMNHLSLELPESDNAIINYEPERKAYSENIQHLCHNDFGQFQLFQNQVPERITQQGLRATINPQNLMQNEHAAQFANLNSNFQKIYEPSYQENQMMLPPRDQADQLFIISPDSQHEESKHDNLFKFRGESHPRQEQIITNPSNPRKRVRYNSPNLDPIIQYENFSPSFYQSFQSNLAFNSLLRGIPQAIWYDNEFSQSVDQRYSNQVAQDSCSSIRKECNDKFTTLPKSYTNFTPTDQLSIQKNQSDSEKRRDLKSNSKESKEKMKGFIDEIFTSAEKPIFHAIFRMIKNMLAQTIDPCQFKIEYPKLSYPKGILKTSEYKIFIEQIHARFPKPEQLRQIQQTFINSCRYGRQSQIQVRPIDSASEEGPSFQKLAHKCTAHDINEFLEISEFREVIKLSMPALKSQKYKNERVKDKIKEFEELFAKEN